MNLVWFDWVLIIIAASFIMKNIHKYFLFQIISLCGWMLTYYSVANYDNFMIIGNEWYDFLAVKYRILAHKTVVFIATIIIFNLLAMILELLFTPKKQHMIFERITGTGSGIIKCCILSNFIVLNAYNLLDKSMIKVIHSSSLFPIIQKISDILSKYILMLIDILLTSSIF